jgi:hypothetical protein
MPKNAKVDLTLIKRLIGELESTLATAESIKTDSKDMVEYIVEMQKAAGLASGVMTEAGLLIGDIVSVAHGTAGPEKDGLSKLLGSVLKGGGGGLPGTN